MKRYLITAVLMLALLGPAAAQNRQLGVYALAFYNIENLFHPYNEDEFTDNEFRPEGAYTWTTEKYQRKLNNIAYVMSRLAKDVSPLGPAVIGVAEVGNRQVLEDLVNTGDLAEAGLEIIHYESPDRRGVDVGLLYNPKIFTPISSAAYPYVNPERPDYVSRDQLLVSGVMAGEMVHVIVNHWPSRYGSKSSQMREAAAAITKHIADSLYRADLNAKIVIMGDLNDDPVDVSTRVVLDAKRNQSEVQPGGLYNTMWQFYDRGIGTLSYQGQWSLFDQLIISHSLLGGDRSTLKFWKSEIFNKDFLLQKDGRNKGYPLRTFSGSQFINGYSDHFPVLVYLVKEIR